MKQALERYAEQVAPTQKGARWEKVRCDKLAGDERGLPFRHKLLTEVTRASIADWRDTALKTLAPASVRREMGLLRQVFEAGAAAVGLAPRKPHERCKRPKNPPPRKRLFDDEVERILLAVGYERLRRDLR